MGKLTDAAIRKAKPGPTRFKLIDSERRGRGRLICRIEPSGAKVFFFRYRTDDADRLILIGQYDPEGKGWSLAKAIERARELGERLKSTPDLKEALELEAKREQAERRAELLQVKEGERQTLRALLNVYVAHLERGEKKLAARDAKGIFTKHVLEAFPRVADMPAAELQARDIAEMMRRLIDKKHDRTAGKLRSYVSAAYALALRAESDPKAPADALAFRLPGNPAAATKAHSGVQARTRTLSEAELRIYMERIAELPDIQRDALALLLLLGGQRPAQLLRVKTTDVDLLGRRISLFDPKGRRSTPRPHVLPLEQAAHEIVARLVARADKFEDCAWLLSSDGDVSLRLETLSACVADVAKAMVKAKESRSSFQLRDLRRTCETMLAGMGISRDVRAQLLSHGIGGVQGVHYDMHGYDREKSSALSAWERRLQAIASGNPEASNVVEIDRTKVAA